VIAILLWLLLQPSDDPQFHARFDSPTAATIQWTQQQRADLYVTHASGAQAYIGHYDGAGLVTVELGHQGPTDATVQVQPGDVYVAEIDGATYRARLAWWRYLAVWRT